ncbi:MAG: hypothetical protein H6582_14365 [Crocinitomicaceae bacterium]|nr:hypothetical protein [Crocinitomicaceae bacterium]
MKENGNKILIFLLFLVCSISLQAQPGWAFKLEGNLNDIDSNQLKKCIQDPLCKLCPIEIDSTTDLRRIEHLNVLTQTTLILNFDKVPKGLEFFDFKNLKQLTIFGNNRLKDISNLGTLQGLEMLSIIGFGGEEIKMDPNSFKGLQTVHINNCTKLNYIDDLLAISNITDLRIWSCPNLKTLIHDRNKQPHVKWLRLYNTPIDPLNLCSFIELELLILDGLSFSSIPNCLAETLEALYISNNDKLVETDGIDRLKNLKVINVENNSLIEDRKMNIE